MNGIIDFQEEWKPLIYQNNIYENYEISNLGHIRRKNSKKILKTYKINASENRGTSYYVFHVSLGKRRQRKSIILHRAVAENFLENPKNLPFVLFVDENPDNLSASNLYWSPHKTTDSYRLQKRRARNVKSVTKRRRKLKEMAVEYKGGKCLLCGYNKCIGALEFHHKDPEEKDFGFSHAGTTKSWERLKVELDKCICVCANCHREIHEGLITQETIINTEITQSTIG